MKKELTSICRLYAISPVHAGSGTATTTVDLPIQREKHTNWPHVQASSVKGAFRDHFRKAFPENQDQINQIFGSDEQDGWDVNSEPIASKVAFSDAKLLAFPVRSGSAPFVHVTCPAVLKRLSRDLEFVGKEWKVEIPDFTNDQFIPIRGEYGDKEIFEDLLLSRKEATFNPDHELLKDLELLVMVSDRAFKYLVEAGTEIQTQIKIDHKTGVTKDGSLRYQELLPQDSVMYIVTLFGSNFDSELQAENVKNLIQENVKDFIQIGGDFTLGRGICKVYWYDI